MTKEIWKQIRDYPYSISNLGRVRRDTNENNTFSGRILKGKFDKNGYHVVTIYRNGIASDFKVHFLVCYYFNGRPRGLQNQVRHLDGNPKNLDPSNLRWGTAKENAEDRDAHGKTQAGERHARAVFSLNGLRKLRQEYQEAITVYGKKYVPRGWIKRKAQELDVNEKSMQGFLKRGYKNIWQRST